MTRVTRRSHPVRLLFDKLGGGEPTKQDFDDLNLAHDVDRGVVERVVRAAAKQMAELRRGGYNGQARRVGIETSDLVIDMVGDPVGPDEDSDPTDPRDLAAMIPRI